MTRYRGWRIRRPHSRLGLAFERAAHDVTLWSGSSWGFGLAALVIVAWLVTGPLFDFSDTWQLVINTGTTIVTFLMVFLIQHSQNKDALALQLKLNEIVAAIDGASNRLIDVEDLSEDELRILHQHYQRLAAMAKRDLDIRRSRSVEEAGAGGRRKREPAPKGAVPSAAPLVGGPGEVGSGTWQALEGALAGRARHPCVGRALACGQGEGKARARVAETPSGLVPTMVPPAASAASADRGPAEGLGRCRTSVDRAPKVDRERIRRALRLGGSPGARLQDLEAHGNDARPHHVETSGGGTGQIDDLPPARAAIVDADHHRTPRSVQAGDAYPGPHRQRGVGGR